MILNPENMDKPNKVHNALLPLIGFEIDNVFSLELQINVEDTVLPPSKKEK